MQDVATETDRQLPDKPEYDFTKLAETLGEALLKASADNVVEADNLHERTKVLVEGIRDQVREQEKLVTDMYDRLRMFGETVLEAHKKFVNGGYS